MGYARVVDGVIVSASITSTGTLSNGKPVSNYHLLPDSVLKSEGWLPIVDDIPVIDKDTQYLQFSSYTIEAERVVKHFIAVDIQLFNPTDDLIDELLSLGSTGSPQRRAFLQSQVEEAIASETDLIEKSRLQLRYVEVA